MAHIALVRIDDRLIHGQVVIKWLRYLDCNEILIVDDDLSRDDFMQNVLRLAAPSGVEVQVIPVQQAANCTCCLSIGESAGDDMRPGSRVLVLLRSPETALRLLRQGFHFSELNVGGLAAGQDTRRLFKSVSASEEHIEALRAMADMGVRVYFQTVPGERPAEMHGLSVPVTDGPA